jgi:hypothetical protein
MTAARFRKPGAVRGTHVAPFGNVGVQGGTESSNLLCSREESCANPVKSQAALVGEVQISAGHRALDFAGTAHRVDHAGKFCQHAIAGDLDDAAVMLADLRIDQFDEMRLEAFVRAFLIGTHQTRIAHHIGGEDRGETAAGGRGGHGSR